MPRRRRHRKIVAPCDCDLVLDWDTAEEWFEAMEEELDRLDLFDKVVVFKEELYLEEWRQEQWGLWEESRLAEVNQMLAATTHIRNNVGLVALAIINGLSDPKLVWDALINAYTANTSLKLRRKFFQAAQGEGVRLLGGWVDRVVELRDVLINSGVTISDEDAVLVLMYGLNERFAHHADWSSAGFPDPVTLDSAVAFLTAHNQVYLHQWAREKWGADSPYPETQDDVVVDPTGYPVGPLQSRREFYRLLQEPGESLNEWVDRVLGVRRSLASSGVEVHDENVIIVLMMGLSEEYQEHRAWIEVTPAVLATLDSAEEYLRTRHS